MTDQKNICGEITDEGDICTLVAGWGRDADDGPCRWHADVRPVPDKLTEQRIIDIEADLMQGHSVRAACGNNDIGEKTHYRWIGWAEDLDEDDTSERADLLRQYQQRVTRANDAGDHYIEKNIIEIAIEKGRADTLLKYLQEKRGGREGQAAKGDDSPLAMIPDDEQLEQLLNEQ